MSFLSTLKHAAYSTSLGARAYMYRSSNSNEGPRVYYGGARSGHRGGPQVKVQLLKDIFPEIETGYNILYLLSGALYMPDYAISKLRKSGVKIVLNQNGVFYPAWYPDSWEEKNKRMASALAQSDYIFYQSEFCKLCADKFLTQPNSAFEVLYNGVDTDFFKPLDRNRENSKPFEFLISGNISSSTFYRLENALEGLVEARKGGLNVAIKFSGILPPPDRDKILYLINQKGMENHFKIGSSYSRSEAPIAIANADAYLMTKHNDPCPNAVLEALSCGLPILYSSSGGVPELVGDQAGVGMRVEQSFDQSPVPSANQIAEGMEVVIKNRDTFSKNARDRAVNLFDIKIWAKRHKDAFLKLLSLPS